MKKIFLTKKKNVGKIDYKFLILLAFLLILGTVMVYSASQPYATRRFGDGYYYIKRQVIYLLVGGLALAITSKIPLHIYKKCAPAVYGICLFLLVIVLFGGFSEGIAKRWLGIPGTPLSFQPSELMKLGIILMLSWYYDIKKGDGYFPEIILPGIVLFVPCGLVLLEKHLSGTIILALIGICIIFIAGTKVKQLIFSYGGVGIASAIIFLLTNSYALKRIQSFFDPNANALDDKWQTNQGLLAIGSGGLWGNGLFNSIQKYSYVSEPQNDFIFTIWCEETGYIGAICLLTIYGLLLWRGMQISINSNDYFSAIVGIGITSQIGIQALLNILVVTDLIPNTGISLPFFSYGGSSLIILMAEMGILLSISRNSKIRR